MRKPKSNYEDLRLTNPIELDRFKGAERRSRKLGLEFGFDASVSGFHRFMEQMGPLPSDMVCPTVGRKNHSIGYVEGNIGWQSKSDNSRECRIRCNTPEARAAHSARMKGNTNGF